MIADPSLLIDSQFVQGLQEFLDTLKVLAPAIRYVSHVGYVWVGLLSIGIGMGSFTYGVIRRAF